MFSGLSGDLGFKLYFPNRESESFQTLLVGGKSLRAILQSSQMIFSEVYMFPFCPIILLAHILEKFSLRKQVQGIQYSIVYWSQPRSPSLGKQTRDKNGGYILWSIVQNIETTNYMNIQKQEQIIK